MLTTAASASTLRNFERRAPQPQPTIRVLLPDGETIILPGDDFDDSPDSTGPKEDDATDEMQDGL